MMCLFDAGFPNQCFIETLFARAQKCKAPVL